MAPWSKPWGPWSSAWLLIVPKTFMNLTFLKSHGSCHDQRSEPSRCHFFRRSLLTYVAQQVLPIGLRRGIKTDQCHNLLQDNSRQDWEKRQEGHMPDSQTTVCESEGLSFGGLKIYWGILHKFVEFLLDHCSGWCKHPNVPCFTSFGNWWISEALTVSTKRLMSRFFFLCF